MDNCPLKNMKIFKWLKKMCYERLFRLHGKRGIKLRLN